MPLKKSFLVAFMLRHMSFRGTAPDSIVLFSNEAEPSLRSLKRHEAANMKDILATMERSGSIHFIKTLPQSAIPALAAQKRAYMTIPALFVHENAHKVEEWVTLRVWSSNGRSSRPWVVRLCIIVKSAAATSVRFVTGWVDFAASNGLRMGDSLIFLLQEDVRSEFEVHIFRGPERSPHFPDLCGSSTTTDNDNDEDEEEKYVSNSKEEESFAEDSDDDNDKQSRVRSRVHHRDARNRASTGYGCGGKTAPEQQTKYSTNDKVFPGFCKVLRVSSIPQTDGISLTRLGQFEFPLDFLETHGEHLQASVQLQGVHEDSPVHVIPCSRSTWAASGHMRICFKPREWNRFVTVNCLKVGQELRFSLTADSYFKVRVI